MEGKTHFEKTVILSIGHVFSVGVSFLIPVFLSRWLEIEAYGTFKLFILIQGLFLAVVHLGMDFGLFYFIKSRPNAFPVFSLNAIIFETVLSLFCATLFLVFGGKASLLFNNPDLALHLLPFFFLILFSIPAQHLDHYFTVLDKIKWAVLSTILHEFLKTSIIIVGYFFFNSLSFVLSGLALLSLAKLGILVTFNALAMKRLRLSWGLLPHYLPAQLKYGLPLGLSHFISVLINFDKFLISAFFNVRQFTLYSVGCFEVPVVHSVTNTMTDLMSFSMIGARNEGDMARVKELWRSTVRKILLIHIPVAAFMVCFSSKVIELVYSSLYAESAFYFRVFSIIFLLTAFDCDLVFRVFARTKSFFLVQLAAALWTLGALVYGATILGPVGALTSKLLADLLTLAVKLSYVKRLMTASWLELFVWDQMLGIAVISIASAVSIARLSASLGLGAAFVVLDFVLYALLVFGLSLITGIIKEDERRYLLSKVQTLTK